MGRKKIYLVRHGQTQFNLDGIVQGASIDSDLNQTGLAQAKAFYEAYHHISFDRVITSTLRRTYQSVQGFIDKGYPWQQHAGFNEISWGVYDGQKITNDHPYWAVLKKWDKGKTSERIEGGESPEDVMVRQRQAWKELFADDKEEIILLCMHGRAMRVLLSWVTDKPLHKMDQFRHKNLGLYVLVQNEEGEVAVEKGLMVDHLRLLPS